MPVLLTKKYPKSIQNIDTEIRERLQRNEADTFISVVPTKRKLRELQRELLHIVPVETSPAFHLFTLETLAARLYSLTCSPKQIVTGPAQAVLMYKAFNLIKNDLRYFVPISRELPKGTFQRIINVINNLKEAGVYPSTLYQEVEAANVGEQSKLHDILKIYEQYEQVLGDRFIDVGGMYKELNYQWQPETVTSLFRKTFPTVDAVFVAGFDEFSDPEITMLEHLVNLDGIGMVISFDYSPDNEELFGHLRENYQKFTELGFRRIGHGPLTESPAGTGDFREHISMNLFRRDANASMECKDRITLFRAEDRQEEVVLIAKLIKRLIRAKADRDLSRICVAMYQPQLYTNLFREVFARYGIPANITDRYALDQSPLIVAIVSLLQVWSNNFRQRDVMRALSGPYFDFTANDEPIDAGNLYEVSTRLKIIAGREYWQRRIQQRLVQITDELIDADDEEELRREEQQLHKAMRDIIALASLLRRFDGKLTPVQFKDRLGALLDELNVPFQILRPRNSISEEQLEKDTRAYQKFLHFIDEFLSLISLQEKEGVGHNHTAPLSFYLNELRVAISQVRYNVRQKYGYGVYVTSLEETRGLQFEVMFIGGLVDGEFPPVYQPEIFLSKTRQQRKEHYHLVEHRYLFYQGITNFTEHLYLSYPRKDGDMELVRSSFLDAFLNVVRSEDWQDKIPEELTSPVYSEEELLLRMGRNIGAAISVGRTPEFDRFAEKSELRKIFGYIHHAIAVEHSRSVTHALREYEGFIYEKLNESVKRKLELFRNNVFSVSQLESYGKCPFQYFAARVLQLKVLEEPEEGLTPLERGGIIHEILFEFYLDRREKNLPPLFECSQEQFAQALNDLISIAQKKLDALNIPDVLWHIDKEMVLGGRGRKGMLQAFLEHERERKLEVVPKYFEASFGPRVSGRKLSDPLWQSEEPIIAGSVKLRGKVDRIEIGKESFTIVDYKTGKKTPKLKEIELGMSLQLPIYLYAVERILAERVGKSFKAAAGIYYKLQGAKEELGLGNDEFNGKAFRSTKRSHQLMSNDDELNKVIQQAIQFVNSYVQGITKGDFPLTTPEKAKRVCRYCNFQRVCRVQTQMPTVLQKT